jgi:chromate reductase
MKNIIAISGSLREKSFNTWLLKAAQRLAPEGVAITLYDIFTLPFYNQDLEATFPEEAQKFKDALSGSDGIIFATPEYNRSVPGVLKNAIDWASRPYGQSAFKGKKVLVLGTTTGNTGASLAQMHLKQIMLTNDAIVLGQPEFYMSDAAHKFDAEGNLLDESTKEHLRKALIMLTQ